MRHNSLRAHTHVKNYKVNFWACVFQINSKTSWIDGSFIYSTSEAWLNTMRSFENGTFRTDENGMPPKNRERVPIMNKPSPHLFKTLSPERMYRKLPNKRVVRFQPLRAADV